MIGLKLKYVSVDLKKIFFFLIWQNGGYCFVCMHKTQKNKLQIFASLTRAAFFIQLLDDLLKKKSNFLFDFFALLEGSAIKCQRFFGRTEYVTLRKWIPQNKNEIFDRLKINLRKLLRRAECVLSLRQAKFAFYYPNSNRGATLQWSWYLVEENQKWVASGESSLYCHIFSVQYFSKWLVFFKR